MRDPGRTIGNERTTLDGKSKNGFLATGGGQVPTGQPGSFTLNELVLDFKNDVAGGGTGAEYFTISFNVTPPEIGCSTEAEVTWFLEGSQIVRRLSIANGTTISGVANGVRVRVFDTTNFYGGPVTAAPYYVDIALGRGTRPSTDEPPRLQGGIVAGIGAGGTFPIPRNAGVISVFASVTQVAFPATQPNYIISFVDASLNLIAVYEILGPGAKTGWIPVPSNAVSMIAAGSGGAPDSKVFSYTWGIEG
jgi:hypothetical protein